MNDRASRFGSNGDFEGEVADGEPDKRARIHGEKLGLVRIKKGNANVKVVVVEER